MWKFVHYIKTILVSIPFALVPFTVVVIIAQGSNPGNPFYPVKLGLESVVLAAASMNPYTKALFATNLADTRYTEAESLLLFKGNTAGLHNFVSQVAIAQQNIANVSNSQQKGALAQQLRTQIDTYQSKLQQDQQQVIASSMTQQTSTFQTQNNSVTPPRISYPPQTANTPSLPQQSQPTTPTQTAYQTILVMNISQTQQELTDIKQNLANIPVPVSPTPSSSPTPTITLTPTSTSTPNHTANIVNPIKGNTSQNGNTSPTGSNNQQQYQNNGYGNNANSYKSNLKQNYQSGEN